MKAIKILLQEKKMDKDIVLLIDEMYLQKEVQFQGGQLIGCDDNNELYKGIMTFMIVGMKKNVSFVVKAIPETKIEGKWLALQIAESIQTLHEIGFHVRAVISDNHPSNVAAFNDLYFKYGCSSHENLILHPSSSDRSIYMFFDSVHLLKNIRNNLLNSKRLIFPEFKFADFIDLPAGEITWKMLHDVFEQDETLQGNLRKANKLTYKVLHPGDNKQSMPLALAIFHATTSAALESYFPEHNSASKFLELINIWWTMSNSKQKLNMNFHLGDAARLNDCKPEFFRKLAVWFSKWKLQQPSNSEKYTLSKQTTSALVITLRCTASLIEDLLEAGYDFVLTARFQTDPLERRFSNYRQVSGGRFLVGLREVNTSERILAIKSLLKESVFFWKEDIQSTKNQDLALLQLTQELNAMSSQLEHCYLDSNSLEVAAFVSGYISKKMIKKTKCVTCRAFLTSSSTDSLLENYDYLMKLSRKGLTIPSVDLTHYVSKSFAMLELSENIFRRIEVPERIAAEHVLTLNDAVLSFLCDEHANVIKFINRSICNIYLNNSQKLMTNHVRRDTVNQFKQRQRKRRRIV